MSAFGLGPEGLVLASASIVCLWYTGS